MFWVNSLKNDKRLLFWVPGPNSNIDGSFPHTTKQLIDTISDFDTLCPEIASGSTGKGSVPRDFLSSSRPQAQSQAQVLTSPVTSPGPHLFFSPIGYKTEVLMISHSTGLINVLRRFIELRETFCSLGHEFLIKEYNPEEPDGRQA